MKAIRSNTNATFSLAPSSSDWEWDIAWQSLHIDLKRDGRLLLSFKERSGGRYHYPHSTVLCGVSDSLRTKTALLFGGLLPAAIYADALQEEIPEAEWAAQQLREWAKWEQQK